MVTVVPPLVEPVVGLIAVSTGGEAVKVKWSADDIADVPPAVVTVTSTVPAGSAGATAVICVLELTVKLAAAVRPKNIAVAPVKLLPVMVTVVPPLLLPVSGVIEVTMGVGA